jgi:hypothetical protein
MTAKKNKKLLKIITSSIFEQFSRLEIHFFSNVLRQKPGENWD